MHLSLITYSSYQSNTSILLHICGITPHRLIDNPPESHFSPVWVPAVSPAGDVTLRSSPPFADPPAVATTSSQHSGHELVKFLGDTTPTPDEVQKHFPTKLTPWPVLTREYLASPALAIFVQTLRDHHPRLAQLPPQTLSKKLMETLPRLSPHVAGFSTASSFQENLVTDSKNGRILRDSYATILLAAHRLRGLPPTSPLPRVSSGTGGGAIHVHSGTRAGSEGLQSPWGRSGRQDGSILRGVPNLGSNDVLPSTFSPPHHYTQGNGNGQRLHIHKPTSQLHQQPSPTKEAAIAAACERRDREMEDQRREDFNAGRIQRMRDRDRGGGNSGDPTTPLSSPFFTPITNAPPPSLPSGQRGIKRGKAKIPPPYHVDAKAEVHKCHFCHHRRQCHKINNVSAVWADKNRNITAHRRTDQRWTQAHLHKHVCLFCQEKLIDHPHCIADNRTEGVLEEEMVLHLWGWEDSTVAREWEKPEGGGDLRNYLVPAERGEDTSIPLRRGRSRGGGVLEMDTMTHATNTTNTTNTRKSTRNTHVVASPLTTGQTVDLTFDDSGDDENPRPCPAPGPGPGPSVATAPSELGGSSSGDGSLRRSARAARAANRNPAPHVRKPSETMLPTLSARESLVGGKGGVTVRVLDLDALMDEQFVNDEAIMFFLTRLQKAMDKENADRVHVFNTHFYSMLTGAAASGGASVFRATSKIKYDRVRKWTKGVDIFTKDFVVIPVNASLHWSLVIVCFPGHLKLKGRQGGTAAETMTSPSGVGKKSFATKKEGSDDDDDGDGGNGNQDDGDAAADDDELLDISWWRDLQHETQAPTMLLLDSLIDSPHKSIGIPHAIRQYLTNEWQRLADEEPFSLAAQVRRDHPLASPCPESLATYRAQSPLQGNHYDCGPCVLTTAALFLLRLPAAWPSQSQKPKAKAKLRRFHSDAAIRCELAKDLVGWGWLPYHGWLTQAWYDPELAHSLRFRIAVEMIRLLRNEVLSWDNKKSGDGVNSEMLMKQLDELADDFVRQMAPRRDWIARGRSHGVPCTDNDNDTSTRNGDRHDTGALSEEPTDTIITDTVEDKTTHGVRPKNSNAKSSDAVREEDLVDIIDYFKDLTQEWVERTEVARDECGRGTCRHAAMVEAANRRRAGTRSQKKLPVTMRSSGGGDGPHEVVDLMDDETGSPLDAGGRGATKRKHVTDYLPKGSESGLARPVATTPMMTVTSTHLVGSNRTSGRRSARREGSGDQRQTNPTTSLSSLSSGLTATRDDEDEVEVEVEVEETESGKDANTELRTFENRGRTRVSDRSDYWDDKVQEPESGKQSDDDGNEDSEVDPEILAEMDKRTAELRARRQAKKQPRESTYVPSAVAADAHARRKRKRDVVHVTSASDEDNEDEVEDVGEMRVNTIAAKSVTKAKGMAKAEMEMDVEVEEIEEDVKVEEVVEENVGKRTVHDGKVTSRFWSPGAGVP